MAKAASKHLGIYISPKEICIAQIRLGKDSKPEPEHLIRIPTEFPVKEGMLRPLSLNHEFFSEKAAWTAAFKQAVKKVRWDSSTAVVTLSPQFAILRYFVMPLVDRRFWSKSIPLESKKYIPVSFEEVVYDFAAVPTEGGKKLGVLFGLTQRKSVEFLTEALKAAGLTLAAVEITPQSMERVFGFLDPKDHDARGYIHFSANSTFLVFSHLGCPVLYRETETDSGGSMSERKRLDIKGAMQFVDRYVGGKDYKAVMLSGDGADLWKPVAEKEAAPIPVETWEAGKLCGLKDNDSASLMAAAAALRGRTGGPASPDISGLSAAANLERQVQSYVWNITFVLGGLLLLLTLLAQARLIMASSKVAQLRARVMNVPELNGLDAGTIRGKIDEMQVSAQTLDILVSEVDPLAPKLAAIADRIPSDLWTGVITYTNPFNFSEGQSGVKELRISGSTYTRGEVKGRLVDAFTKALKAAEEFKVFTPPMGGIDSTTESGAPSGSAPDGFQQSGRMTSEFSVMCTRKRK
jgi:hypothetical protein